MHIGDWIAIVGIVITGFFAVRADRRALQARNEVQTQKAAIEILHQEMTSISMQYSASVAQGGVGGTSGGTGGGGGGGAGARGGDGGSIYA